MITVLPEIDLTKLQTKTDEESKCTQLFYNNIFNAPTTHTAFGVGNRQIKNLSDFSLYWYTQFISPFEKWRR